MESRATAGKRVYAKSVSRVRISVAPLKSAENPVIYWIFSAFCVFMHPDTKGSSRDPGAYVKMGGG